MLTSCCDEAMKILHSRTSSKRHTNVTCASDHPTMTRWPIDLTVLVALTIAMVGICAWLIRPL
jgi:hypothetical protein